MMISRRGAVVGGLGLGALSLGALSLAGMSAQAEGGFAEYSEAGLAKAFKSGRPVLVHVHANW